MPRRALRGPGAWLTGLLLLSLACNFFVPAPLPQPTAAPSLTPSARPATPTPRPRPTAAATPAASPTLEAGSAPATGLRPEHVRFHPGPRLYSGDLVSLEIDAPGVDPAWQEATVRLHPGTLQAAPLASAQFGRFGLGERAQATLYWAWDTAGLSGPQTVVLSVDPAGPDSTTPRAPLSVLTLTVELLPAAQRPPPEPVARWAQAESDCCVFHYLTHTAAERDLALIQSRAEADFAHLEALLGVTRTDKVAFTLLGRLLGHGGFAADEISLTYIDRNAAGNNLETIFRHEATHVLDRSLSAVRPALVAEGLAVYAAGGHFKPEELQPRLRALLELGRYIPLAQLADDFYPSQHEIGYLQAGAFLEYLVDTYGWEQFRAFYAAFRQEASEAGMLDAALRAAYGLSLSEVEARWLEQARTRPLDPAQLEDLRLSIELYDTLRRYQQLKDPEAYFLTAWLPNAEDGRQRGIVADFVRHPSAAENVALEAMLAEARRALEAGEFGRTESVLRAVNVGLQADDLLADPLTRRYLEIVQRVQALGYEAQTIRLEADRAWVQAIRDWPRLEQLTLEPASP